MESYLLINILEMAFAGVSLALVLKWAGLLPGWKAVLFAALAWPIGALVATPVFMGFDEGRGVLDYAFAGFVGGAVTVWQLRRAAS